MPPASAVPGGVFMLGADYERKKEKLNQERRREYQLYIAKVWKDKWLIKACFNLFLFADLPPRPLLFLLQQKGLKTSETRPLPQVVSPPTIEKKTAHVRVCVWWSHSTQHSMATAFVDMWLQAYIKKIKIKDKVSPPPPRPCGCKFLLGSSKSHSLRKCQSAEPRPHTIRSFSVWTLIRHYSEHRKQLEVTAFLCNLTIIETPQFGSIIANVHVFITV